MAQRDRTATRRRLALNVRKLRLARGWTQENAAEHIGCSLQGFQRIERAVARVTIDLAADIAAGFRVDVQELLAPVGAWKKPKTGRPRQVKVGPGK